MFWYELSFLLSYLAIILVLNERLATLFGRPAILLRLY